MFQCSDCSEGIGGEKWFFVLHSQNASNDLTNFIFTFPNHISWSEHWNTGTKPCNSLILHGFSCSRLCSSHALFQNDITNTMSTWWGISTPVELLNKEMGLEHCAVRCVSKEF